MITAVLGAIVVGLAAANIVVSLKEKRLQSYTKEKSVEMNMSNKSTSSVVLFGNNKEAGEIAKLKRELALIRNDLQKSNARIDFAFKKIHKIENALGKNNRGNLAYNNLLEKIEKLEDFRREALIEIEAIKQHLQLPAKKKETLDKELEEKIHKLVFRSKEVLK